MRLLGTADSDLDEAAAALRGGFLVALPTETVYGLGVNALNAAAVARVFAVKQRPSFDPLIVHISNFEQAADFARIDIPYARILAERFWPGPLTLILPKIKGSRGAIPDIVTSGLATIALRCPAHPVAMSILVRADIPVAAPSANPFGYLSPTKACHVTAAFGSGIDFVVDGGDSAVGVESTVVDISSPDKAPCILRHGGVPMERIQDIIPEACAYETAGAQPKAPGQLPSHYAPSLPLRLTAVGALPEARPRKPAAALCFGADEARHLNGSGLWDTVIDLSPARDTVEAAARLFDAMHQLDTKRYAELWAARLPDEGLGRAINDRLYKASVK